MKHIKNKNKKNTHIKIKKINIFFISHLTVPTPTLGHFRKTRLDSMLVHGPQRWEKRGAVTLTHPPPPPLEKYIFFCKDVIVKFFS